MNAKIPLIIVLSSVLAIVIGILVPVDNTIQPQQFPWQIEHTLNGNTQVFGLTLQVSKLHEIEQLFNSSAELNLFSDKNQQRTVEAYFDKINLGGLSAKVVATLDIDPQRLETLYSSGSRISALGNGRSKVTLKFSDITNLKYSVVKSIAYLPSVTLSDKLLLDRFGEPMQKIQERNNATQHWLYPTLGLDIARNVSNKAVLQYVSKADFAELVDPLIDDHIGIDIVDDNH